MSEPTSIAERIYREWLERDVDPQEYLTNPAQHLQCSVIRLALGRAEVGMREKGVADDVITEVLRFMVDGGRPEFGWIFHGSPSAMQQ